MIDLPIGKTLTAELSPIKCNCECFDDDDYVCPQQAECCKGCYFDEEGKEYAGEVCDCLCCIKETRADGKKVIYKVLDCG